MIDWEEILKLKTIQIHREPASQLKSRCIKNFQLKKYKIKKPFIDLSLSGGGFAVSSNPTVTHPPHMTKEPEAPEAREMPTMRAAAFSSGPAESRSSSPVAGPLPSHIQSLSLPRVDRSPDIYQAVMIAFSNCETSVLTALPNILKTFLECSEVRIAPFKGKHKMVGYDELTTEVVTFNEHTFLLVFPNLEAKVAFESSKRSLLEYILVTATAFSNEEKRRDDVCQTLAMITHVISSQLTVCVMNATQLQKDVEEGNLTELPSTATDIATAAITASKRLNQYRAIMTKRELVIHPVPMAIQGELEKIVSSTKHRTGVNIRFLSTLQNERVLLDPGIFSDVLMELFENAIKYCDSQHSSEDIRISVYAHRVGNTITVKVVDNGPGIDDLEIDGLFDMYKRGSITAGACRGSGIGLAFCRAMCEKHEGSIVAENREDQRGAVFTVTLPLSKY
ncbi:sensor histidine kinase [Pseudomonadota bacterium]